MKKKSNNAVIQYLKFIVVGSINAIVNYVAYAAVVFVGGHYVLATLVGFVLSVLSSYLINSSLVFVHFSQSINLDCFHFAHSPNLLHTN